MPYIMTKVVQLSDEAYARLRILKRGGESFSEVVLRLTSKRDLRGLRGLRTAAELDTSEALIHAADSLDKPAVD